MRPITLPPKPQMKRTRLYALALLVSFGMKEIPTIVDETLPLVGKKLPSSINQRGTTEEGEDFVG